MSLLNEMSSEDLPREKLARYGAASLSNEELMALFLGSGTKGHNVFQVCRDLLKTHGSLANLGRLSVHDLAKTKGIGPAKASNLAAAFEIGARVAREKVVSAPLDTPQLIYEFFAPQLAHLSIEQVIVATLDTRLNHTGTVIISQGSVNESYAHPREILRPVIARNAYGFILAHNHPSGDPSPSRADHRVTENLIKAVDIMNVRLIDHLIIGRPGEGRAPYFSFREAGVIL